MKAPHPMFPTGSAGKVSTLLLGATVLLLTGCNDNDNASMPQTSPPAEKQIHYSVEVTNLTAGQPFSPLALIAHTPGWHVFTTGESASYELETLAESGDNGPLLAAADADKEVLHTESGTGILAPGQTDTLSFSVSEEEAEGLSFSLVSMLVNTNDAVAAVNDAHLDLLAAGDARTFTLLTYDAGTEANTESADSVPGPAAAGGAREGFNPARDDVRNAVHVHAGVVTQEDGLASSTLTGEHRWDHPAVQVRVTRMD